MTGLTKLDFEEFKKIVKALRSVYTNNNLLADEDSIKMWYALLKDIPYSILSPAVQKYIVLNKFAPTIADIRETASQLTNEPVQDWGSGWEIVQKCIHVCGQYREEEALGRMDSITRQTVKRLGWLSLCISESPETDRANFRMIYEQLSKRSKEQNMLPEKLKDKLFELCDKHSQCEAVPAAIKNEVLSIVQDIKKEEDKPNKEMIEGAASVLRVLRGIYEKDDEEGR